MRKVGVGLMLGAVLLFSGCTVWSEHPAHHWTDATGGEGLERIFWNEVKAKDWTELERHMAGNYVFTGPEGRLDRQAALDRLKQFELEEYSLGEMQVELNTQTLVVTYTLTLRGTRAGQPLRDSPVRLLAVWQHQKAGWMAIAHSIVSTQAD
jgi:ketosteroid isomerase-like protein